MIGDRINSRRAVLGIIQKDLALKSGLGTAIISRYERGSATPSKRALIKMASALDCSVEWLETGILSSESKTVSISLPSHLIERLSDIANAEGRPLEAEIMLGLELHCSSIEGRIINDSRIEALLRILEREK